MKKTYKTLSYANLTKSIFVAGKEVMIEFYGGRKFPVFQAGIFSTSSPELQKAIRKSSGYGIDYITEKKIVKQVKEIKQKNISEIQSKQMAIEWISQNLKKDFSPSDDIKLIKNFLYEKGYIMNNWK